MFLIILMSVTGTLCILFCLVAGRKLWFWFGNWKTDSFRLIVCWWDEFRVNDDSTSNCLNIIFFFFCELIHIHSFLDWIAVRKNRDIYCKSCKFIASVDCWLLLLKLSSPYFTVQLATWVFFLGLLKKHNSPFSPLLTALAVPRARSLVTTVWKMWPSVRKMWPSSVRKMWPSSVSKMWPPHLPYRRNATYDILPRNFGEKHH